MDLVVILFIGLMIAIAFGLFGGWISGEKGRDRNQGAFIGFLFGPLGCLILALLPSKEAPRKSSVAARRPRAQAWEDDEPENFRVPETWGKPKPKRDDDEDNVLRYLDGTG